MATDTTEEYFESYADLEVHKLMLSDRVRNEAYRAAICDNPEMFKDKTVLDVGTGTGFLAILCAKAGAKKVYAVEASDMAELATITVHENKVADVVEVVSGKVEDVELPEKVDIIVSEWMGFYLLHESMLDSVIFARDKYLKPDGVMYPYKCTLYTAPCYSPDLFKFWTNISGVQMTLIGQLYQTKYTGKPEIMDIESNNVLSTPFKVLEFETKTITLNELNHISSIIPITCNKNGNINCIGLWFDVYFYRSNTKNDIILSTSPISDSKVVLDGNNMLNSGILNKSTHWKQTAIILPIEKSVTPNEELTYKLNISKNENNPRHYNIEFSIDDGGQEEINAEEDQDSVDGRVKVQKLNEKKEFSKHHNADSDYDEYNSGDDDDD